MYSTRGSLDLGRHTAGACVVSFTVLYQRIYSSLPAAVHLIVPRFDTILLGNQAASCSGIWSISSTRVRMRVEQVRSTARVVQHRTCTVQYHISYDASWLLPLLRVSHAYCTVRSSPLDTHDSMAETTHVLHSRPPTETLYDTEFILDDVTAQTVMTASVA